jgi:hypothetical protein
VVVLGLLAGLIGLLTFPFIRDSEPLATPSLPADLA